MVSESETDMLAKTLVNIVYKKVTMNRKLTDTDDQEVYDIKTVSTPIR